MPRRSATWDGCRSCRATTTQRLSPAMPPSDYSKTRSAGSRSIDRLGGSRVSGGWQGGPGDLSVAGRGVAPAGGEGFDDQQAPAAGLVLVAGSDESGGMPRVVPYGQVQVPVGTGD